ncbi:UNVERIFIED_CONTAM: hypothetical protein HDU68_006200 [Siphonaria sp. JEL0065]|nr:hypothetical protein HDU68_006200 [Siphonaria sp. JEL0065]
MARKNVNNELYLAIYNPYKGVDPWSKQISVPHAKQGLQTDIVMGDDQVYAQYNSTMKDHYPRHTDLAQKCVEREVPAGRPLGPPSAKTKVNVVFGDSMKHQPERLRSVATDDYVLYSNELIKESNNPAKDKEKEERARELDSWQSKKELMMSSAHVGTATREDIPFDTRHFANFTSTNTDAYVTPTNVQPLIRFDLKPREASHIPQGDRDKQTSYATESTTSFIPHNIQSIGKERDRGFHTKGTNKALLGKSGEHTGQQRGRSNIAFGQHFEEPKTNFIANEKKKESVTQRDFTAHGRVSEPEAPDAHVKWSKNFLVERDNEDGIKTGMTSALQPDNRNLQYISCASNDMSSINNEKYKAATGPPVVCAVNSQMMYRSSIPTGDETKFPSKELSTITSNSYPAYPNFKMPTFPVPGAQITKTGFSLGDGVGSGKDFGVSTSAAAFVNHGRRFKNVEKSKNGYGLNMLKAANEEYQMSDNKTTNSVVYKSPREREIARAFEPKNAQTTLLFPLQSHVNTETAYETTTKSFYNMRDGLLDVTQPQEVKNRSLSSIVFGDKRHFTTHGDPVF